MAEVGDPTGQTFTRNGIYRPRWQVWYPWSCTRWWAPRLPSRGGDEWCNDSVILPFWFLGSLVVFWRLKRRSMPCPEDWALMSDDDRADYAPCGYYWDGRISEDGHEHRDTGMCDVARQWLDTRADAGVAH